MAQLIFPGCEEPPGNHEFRYRQSDPWESKDLSWLMPGAGLIANCHQRDAQAKALIKFSGLYLRGDIPTVAQTSGMVMRRPAVNHDINSANMPCLSCSSLMWVLQRFFSES